MKIKMLKNSMGSNDGLYVSRFREGHIYCVPHDISLNLANVFVNDLKVAIVHIDEVVEVKPIENIEAKVKEEVNEKVKQVRSKKKKSG